MSSYGRYSDSRGGENRRYDNFNSGPRSSGHGSYGGRRDDRGGYGGYGGGGGRRDGGSYNSFGGPSNIDWSTVKLSHFEKNFYYEHPDVQKRSEEQAKEWRARHTLSVEGNGIPKPCLTFDEASMPDYVLNEITACGFENPTPIQSQGWPMALQGRDMIGISATGSGKTLAFILPAMVHINAQEYLEPGDGPIVLVLAPTRELAQQIQTECDKYGRSSEIKNTCVTGGNSAYSQEQILRKGVEICIATPGRLIDLLEKGVTNLRRVTYLVLDEADRMLDQGFEKQLRIIISHIRPDRQTLMWSATWPDEAQRFARDYLKDPYQVTVGSIDLTANVNITQQVHVCTDMEKFRLLTDMLKSHPELKKILIFVKQRKNVDMLADSIRREGYKTRAMHGKKDQKDREYSLREFASGRCPILVASDVCARGIDVKNIDCVVVYDMSDNMEDYVHRIGRTGRAGAKGLAVVFFTQEHIKLASKLVDILREANQEVPRELMDMAGPPRGGRHYGGGGPYGGRGRGY